jgi:hypothetical protein
MEAENMDSNGTLFIGDKGKIFCGVYGSKPQLLPESSMLDYKRPPKTIPRVPGNSGHEDWIRACKGGPPACSNFAISGPFTEWVLLGNLAIRLGKAGQPGHSPGQETPVGLRASVRHQCAGSRGIHSGQLSPRLGSLTGRTFLVLVKRPLGAARSKS